MNFVPCIMYENQTRISTANSLSSKKDRRAKTDN